MRKVETENSPANYDTYLDSIRSMIDREISRLTPAPTNFRLSEKISFVLGTKGKRLRPILVVLSAQSVGGGQEEARKVALSIELLHTATLIHDDILDNDGLRRNELTANAKWGVRDAVLVGDLLATLSFDLVSNYGKEVLRVLSRTCLMLCDGEYMDVENAADKLSEQEYMETISRKSASLFEAATRCGALVGNGTRHEISALSEFGKNFGLAYQIRDDLLDATSPLEESFPQDIVELRATLPIIHFCQSAEAYVREAFLRDIDSIKSSEVSKRRTVLNRLKERFQSTGSLRYCSDRIGEYVEKAVHNAKSLRETVYREYLIRMANSLRVEDLEETSAAS